MNPNALTPMSILTPSARRIACAGATLLLASISLAGDPPSATYPHKFSFAGPKVVPSDVAIFAPKDSAISVFVADCGPIREVQRHAGAGANVPNASYAAFFATGYPQIGLAVNDKPGSINYGSVLATDVWSGYGLLHVLDTNLAFVNYCALFLNVAQTAWIAAPVDVAFDEVGNVYVADGATKRVYRFDAADVAVGGILVATRTYGSGALAPTGVSVDHNGRVHVSYNQGASYEVFDSGGALVASDYNSAALGSGVCALNPCADGFLLRFDSSFPRYEFTRFDWDWIDKDGAFDLSAGFTLPLRRPQGMEFQKHFYVTGMGLGWVPARSEERMYICNMYSMEVFGQGYDSAPVPAGLRAWWRFDDVHEFLPFEVAGVIDDYVGLNDATAGAVVPHTVEGMVRCALDTRGGTAFATAADSADLNFGTGSISIEGWLRSEQRNGTVTVLDKRVDDGAGYSVFLHDGRVGFQTNVGSDYQNFGSPVVIADGRWRHFAIVLDRDSDDTLTIYVDGAKAASTDALPGDVDNTGPLYFGRVNPDEFGIPLIGAIDEITFCDEPLSATQVAGIAAARSAGKHVWVSPGG
jgi:hypothetical protein